jgi:hypothetical protein
MMHRDLLVIAGFMPFNKHLFSIGKNTIKPNNYQDNYLMILFFIFSVRDGGHLHSREDSFLRHNIFLVNKKGQGIGVPWPFYLNQ